MKKEHAQEISGPVIGFLGEYDVLPGLSQMAGMAGLHVILPRTVGRLGVSAPPRFPVGNAGLIEKLLLLRKVTVERGRQLFES